MAEVLHKLPLEQDEVVVVADVPQPAPPIPAVEKEAPPLPQTENNPVKEDQFDEESNTTTDEKIPESVVGFKEESTKVADLLGSEKKALEDLRKLVEEALRNHEFSNARPPPPSSTAEENNKQVLPEKTEEQKKPSDPEEKVEMVETGEKAETSGVDDDGAKTVEAIEETIVAVSSSSATEDQNLAKETETREEVSIWGIPLLADERSDVILLKFLRAREFKVKEAFTMLKKTIEWRKEFGIEELVEEELGNDELGKAVFMEGVDKEGHPVCYNVYGEFQDKKVYEECFSDEEKRKRFLRWRIQFLKRSIRKLLDFKPGGISTFVQVNDLNHSPGPTKKELRQATNLALQLLQDNYPEFVAKQVFINVPWWYLAVNRMISPFLTQRTRSKFVFAGPSKSAETLLRYIAAEQIPVKYGGMSKDGGFNSTDAVTEITVKPAAKHTVEFPVSEKCVVSWEVRVIGWDVKYGAEFVPNAEESYSVIIGKGRKIGSNEEQVVLCNSFKVGEAGKIVLTIHNPTSKKKKLLYRFKTNISSF